MYVELTDTEIRSLIVTLKAYRDNCDIDEVPINDVDYAHASYFIDLFENADPTPTEVHATVAYEGYLSEDTDEFRSGLVGVLVEPAPGANEDQITDMVLDKAEENVGGLHFTNAIIVEQDEE